MDPSEISLSVIIPAYNEEKRLEKTLEILKGYLSARYGEYEVIVVDDGSSDRTADIALGSGLASEGKMHLMSNPGNMGKGFSVREGLKRASGELILFTDADMSTPIEELTKLEAGIKAGADIAIGSRSINGSKVEVSQPAYRVLMGKTFNLFVRLFTIKGIIDTQCGFKLFKRDIVNDVVPYLKMNGFSFDVELLYLAEKKGYKIDEIPVIWRDSSGSKVNPLRDSVKMFFDLLYIRRIHRGEY